MRADYNINKVLSEVDILAAEFSATRLVRGKEEDYYNLPTLDLMLK